MADTGASASIVVTVEGLSASVSGDETLEAQSPLGDLSVDGENSLEVAPGPAFTGKSAARSV